MQARSTFYSIFGITSIVVLGVLFTGCATNTHSSAVEGKFFVPSTITLSKDVQPELKQYVVRFEQDLEYYGFRIGDTSDPQAFQLRLEYTGEASDAKVAAYLLQDGKPVIEASATPRTWAPWDWGSLPSNKDELIAGLANNAAKEFDGRLREFMSQVRVESSQGSVSSAVPASSGIVAFGTAFAVNSPNTYITAQHVVAGAGKIALYCGAGKTASARIDSIDAGNDIAVLHSDMGAAAYLILAPDDSAQTGDHVFTMGFPTPDILGVAPKYTDGVISSLSGFGDTKNLMQVTVPIQPGNSGGPLVDSQGRVVGVIVSTAAVSYFIHDTGTIPQDVNFAVSSYYAYPLVKGTPLSKDASLVKMSPIKRVTDSICLVAVEQ